MTPRERMLSDVISTIVEGGTGYWAEVLAYDWGDDRNTTAVLQTTEESDTPLVIGLNVRTVGLSMRAIRDWPEVPVADRFRELCAVALATNDAGDIDADAADVIAQVHAFGEVVYG